MASTCESGSCETKAVTESCGSPCEGTCPCGTECGGDPIACATAMWCGSFFQAMKGVQVDLLKAKIQKAWGAKMDKAADIILEAMGVKWQAMLAEAGAKAGVREKLQRIWEEGK